MPITLDALLRHMSCAAEEMFKVTGEVSNIWLLENAAGDQTGIHTPICTPPDMTAGEYKECLDACLRQAFAELGVARYAHAHEAWTLVGPSVGNINADHPERREAVIIEASDGDTTLAVMREIVRPETGKPYLGEESPIGSNSGGRFANMLRPREVLNLERPTLN
jgi:hypothetical protein